MCKSLTVNKDINFVLQWRHPRACGDPVKEVRLSGGSLLNWVPAFAGMTFSFLFITNPDISLILGCLGVEGITQSVADKVQGEKCDRKQDARAEQQPWKRFHRIRALTDEVTP